MLLNAIICYSFLKGNRILMHSNSLPDNYLYNFSLFSPTHFPDDIAEYFGVKVALYFAWLGHYTCALGVPAVFGTLLWAALYGRSEVSLSVSLFLLVAELINDSIHQNSFRTIEYLHRAVVLFSLRPLRTLDTYCSHYSTWPGRPYI